MTSQQIYQWWDKFWFEPRSTLPVCIFRILIGLLLIERELLKAPYWLTWYGNKGIVGLDTCQLFWGAPCINLFIFLPPTDTCVCLFTIVFSFVIAMFTVGWWTRTSTFFLYLMLTTFD